MATDTTTDEQAEGDTVESGRAQQAGTNTTAPDNTAQQASMPPPVPREQAIEHLLSLRRAPLPRFHDSGAIIAAMGTYWVTGKGNDIALLHAPDPQDFQRANRYPSMPGYYPASDGLYHVIDAGDARTTRARLFSRIIAHQEELYDAVLNKGTLYAVSDEKWESENFIYTLEEVEPDATDESENDGSGDPQGPGAADASREKRYNVYVIDKTALAEEKRDRAHNDDTSNSMLLSSFRIGEDQGPMTHNDATRLIQQDYHDRVRRMGRHADSVKTPEKLRNPGIMVGRFLARTSAWVRSRAFRKDVGRTVLGLIQGPVDLASMAAEGLFDLVFRERKDRLARFDPDIRALATIDMSGRLSGLVAPEADPEKIQDYRLLTRSEMDVRPPNLDSHDLHDTNDIADWLFHSIHATEGAMVRVDETGLISVRHPNGIEGVLDPAGKLALLRFNPDNVVDGAPGLPEDARRLLETVPVLELYKEKSGITARGHTLESLRDLAEQATGTSAPQAELPMLCRALRAEAARRSSAEAGPLQHFRQLFSKKTGGLVDLPDLAAPPASDKPESSPLEDNKFVANQAVNRKTPFQRFKPGDINIAQTGAQQLSEAVTGTRDHLHVRREDHTHLPRRPALPAFRRM